MADADYISTEVQVKTISQSITRAGNTPGVVTETRGEIGFQIETGNV